MKFIKLVISDILYVSKLTQTKNKKRNIAVSIIFSQLSAVADLTLIAFFSYSIANQVSGIHFVDKLTNFLSESSYQILILVILRFIFLILQSFIIRKIELDVTKNLKEIILEEIFNKRTYTISDSFFYINELSGHIGYFYSNVAAFINSLLQVLLFSFYLVNSNLNIITIFGVGTLILFIPIKKIIKISRIYIDKTYQTMIQSMKEIERVVENLFLIKIMKTEKREITKFASTVSGMHTLMLKNHIYNLVNGFLPSFLTLFILGLIIAFFKDVSKLTLDFLGVTLKLFNTISSLSKSTTNILNSHVHMTKFKELKFNLSNNNENNFKLKQTDYIELNNVTFQYLNAKLNIFENFSVLFEKGKHTILTGENGTGKSTLLGLIAGVYYPKDGFVSTFSDKYSYVSAQPYIFNDSMKNNLIYGFKDLDIDDNELINLLKKFDTFKDDSDYDLNKIISNKTLSSGQMQKIGFIRAIVSKPDIILLDESTSNLDYISKEQVFTELKKNNITIINSTHDPENFNFADLHYQIFIDEGKRKIQKIKKS